MKYFILHLQNRTITKKLIYENDDAGLEAELLRLLEYNQNPPNENASKYLMPCHENDYDYVRRKCDHMSDKLTSDIVIKTVKNEWL